MFKGTKKKIEKVCKPKENAWGQKLECNTIHLAELNLPSSPPSRRHRFPFNVPLTLQLGVCRNAGTRTLTAHRDMRDLLNNNMYIEIYLKFMYSLFMRTKYSSKRNRLLLTLNFKSPYSDEQSLMSQAESLSFITIHNTYQNIQFYYTQIDAAYQNTRIARQSSRIQ